MCSYLKYVKLKNKTSATNHLNSIINTVENDPILKKLILKEDVFDYDTLKKLVENVVIN